MESPFFVDFTPIEIRKKKESVIISEVNKRQEKN